MLPVATSLTLFYHLVLFVSCCKIQRNILLGFFVLFVSCCKIQRNILLGFFVLCTRLYNFHAAMNNVRWRHEAGGSFW